VILIESKRQVRIQVEDISHVGECRRAAQQLAKTHEFNELLVGQIGIIATELTINVVKHAGRGELLIQAIEDGLSVTLEMITLDRGPGMAVEQCMRDGYSTTGTLGTGLGAISRLSTLFDAYSVHGQGTVAVSRTARQREDRSSHTPPAKEGPEVGAICVAVAGEVECGDTWRIADRPGRTAVLVVDGLGHGPLAATASRAAAATFSTRPFDAPMETMQHLHRTLAGARGAAAACAVVDGANSKLAYCGIGNISGAVVSAQTSRGLVSHNGTLGVQFVRKQQFEYECTEGDRLVMHSDGMSARWSLAAYPGLFVRHPAVIAGVLYRDHARPRDDVTVVVVSGVPR
jgi:anti-sigma regulatory factor (Ser/Thr protein kinase)